MLNLLWIIPAVFVALVLFGLFSYAVIFTIVLIIEWISDL